MKEEICMNYDVDRVEFYKKLRYCKSIYDVKKIIDEIENDDLLFFIQQKYENYIKYNKTKNVEIKGLIIFLECAFLEFIKDKK